MRRDQRRLRLLLILLTLTSLTLVTLDIRGGAGGLGSFRSVIRGIVSPIESAASTVWRPIKNAASSVVHLGRDRETAKRLAKENADLRGQLEKYQTEAKDRSQLDSLLTLAGRGQYRIVPAKVIAFGDITGYEWTVIIDVGSMDRVTKDMTVTTGEGLVGRVLSVNKRTSVVLLCVDAQSSVGARVEGPGEVGTLDGQGRDPMHFTQLSKATVLKAGQRVVTYGSSNNSPFVPGVPIGVISKVVTSPNGLSRDALVEPYVNMTTLDIVGVIIEPPRTDPRDSVLPPKPSPSPSVNPSGSPSPGAGPSGTAGGGVPASPSPSPSPGG